jgi:hypothetical protein
MTRKADFNAEEWELVTSAPALAATAVAAADRGGTLREGLSMARTYQEVRQEGSSELLEAVLTSPPAVGTAPQGRTSPDELRERALDAVRRATDLLRDKASDRELEDYGDFVVRVSEAVARAHKEGGVLGFGGKEVSPSEQAVLDELLTALGPRPGDPAA